MSAVRESQEPNRSVGHHLGCCADGNGKHTGNIDADVLDRQGTPQGDLDLDRLEAQVLVVLEQRPHERGTTMDGLGSLALLCLAINYQYLVAGAAFVIGLQQDNGREEDHRHKSCEDSPGRSSFRWTVLRIGWCLSFLVFPRCCVVISPGANASGRRLFMLLHERADVGPLRCRCFSLL